MKFQTLDLHNIHIAYTKKSNIQQETEIRIDLLLSKSKDEETRKNTDFHLL